MNFTPLNADTDTQRGAIEGQGSNNINLRARRLRTDKAKTPDQISLTADNPFLYMQLQSPEDIQASRVIVQVMGTANPRIAISGQINNRLNPTMQDHKINGGTRKSI